MAAHPAAGANVVFQLDPLHRRAAGVPTGCIDGAGRDHFCHAVFRIHPTAKTVALVHVPLGKSIDRVRVRKV